MFFLSIFSYIHFHYVTMQTVPSHVEEEEEEEAAA